MRPGLSGALRGIRGAGAAAFVPLASACGSIGPGSVPRDRPTISYAPLSGGKFARSLLQPLPPSEVFEPIQAHYPADGVLQVTVRAMKPFSLAETGVTPQVPVLTVPAC
ncbi:MAG: hypothetical protein JSR21_01945 [Proteobacteria bacterium]|nr:hypothetical protein [Pseudomonadota bacterium]